MTSTCYSSDYTSRTSNRQNPSLGPTWRLCHPVNIYVYLNGVIGEKPVLCHIPMESKKNMTKVCEAIQNRLKLRGSYPSALYTLNGIRICQSYELDNYAKYVVVRNGDKWFRCLDYVGESKDPLVVMGERSKHVKSLRYDNKRFDLFCRNKIAVMRPFERMVDHAEKNGLGPMELNIGKPCGELCHKIQQRRSEQSNCCPQEAFCIEGYSMDLDHERCPYREKLRYTCPGLEDPAPFPPPPPSRKCNSEWEQNDCCGCHGRPPQRIRRARQRGKIPRWETNEYYDSNPQWQKQLEKIGILEKSPPWDREIPEWLKCEMEINPDWETEIPLILRNEMKKNRMCQNGIPEWLKIEMETNPNWQNQLPTMLRNALANNARLEKQRPSCGGANGKTVEEEEIAHQEFLEERQFVQQRRKESVKQKQNKQEQCDVSNLPEEVQNLTKLDQDIFNRFQNQLDEELNKIANCQLERVEEEKFTAEIRRSADQSGQFRVDEQGNCVLVSDLEGQIQQQTRKESGKLEGEFEKKKNSHDIQKRTKVDEELVNRFQLKLDKELNKVLSGRFKLNIGHDPREEQCLKSELRRLAHQSYQMACEKLGKFGSKGQAYETHSRSRASSSWQKDKKRGSQQPPRPLPDCTQPEPGNSEFCAQQQKEQQEQQQQLVVYESEEEELAF